MSAGLDDCYSPIARPERLEHLLLLAAPEEHIPTQVWDTVHAEVQRILGDLDDEVRCRVPEATVASGRTTGQAFLLFSYRTFRLPEAHELDAVVAGMTFSFKGGQIVVRGDISGEEQGDLIDTIPAVVVNFKRAQRMAALRE
ncbi:MAG: hypothetical protein WBF93_13850, partial [Pirellulales bacterium]